MGGLTEPSKFLAMLTVKRVSKSRDDSPIAASRVGQPLKNNSPQKDGARDLTDTDAFAINISNRSALPNTLCTWTFNVFLDNKESLLPFVALELLRPFLVSSMVSEAVALSITTKLCATYTQLPFHNVFHGVSTMQVALTIAHTVPKVSASLTDFEVFLLAVASLGHDAGHTGYNNAYEVAVKSSIALAHGNDGPVLERFHASQTNAIIEASGALAFLDDNAREAALYSIMSAIMATDMAQHNAIVNDLEQCIETDGGLGALSLDALLCPIVHCADLSAHAFSRDVSLAWTARISDEFANQINAEKCSGLLQTPFLLGLERPLARMKMQAFFCTTVVMPLWRALAALCDGALDEPMRNLNANAEYYADECKSLIEESKNVCFD